MTDQGSRPSASAPRPTATAFTQEWYTMMAADKVATLQLR